MEKEKRHICVERSIVLSMSGSTPPSPPSYRGLPDNNIVRPTVHGHGHAIGTARLMHELWAPACGTRPDHPTPSMQQREDAVSPCTREHRVRGGCGGGGDTSTYTALCSCRQLGRKEGRLETGLYGHHACRPVRLQLAPRLLDSGPEGDMVGWMA